MSSTGIKEKYFDYALFYNNFTCLSDINCSGLSIYNSINNLYGLSGTTLLNANNLNVSGTSQLNGVTTCIASLNVSGITILNGVTTCISSFRVSGLTTLSTTTINGTLTGNNIIVFIGTVRSSLYVSGIATLNNIVTLGSSLYVSGVTILNSATTCSSTLNVIGNIIGSGSSLTNLNYNAITNPPNLSFLPLSGGTLTGNVTINTPNSGVLLVSGSGAAFGQASGAGAYSSSAAIGDAIVRSAASSNLILQSGVGSSAIMINSSNNIILNNTTTLNGSLTVSGNTIMKNFTTINSPLYINTNQTTTISALNINCTSVGVLVNIVQNLGWNDGVNYALNVSGYSMFGGVQINGQDTNNIYKRVGNLTIASPSTDSIILKTNYGTWEAMRLNTGGTSINTSLYISGLAILNNATTCLSTLNVSSAINANGNSLVFPNVLSDFKITLYSGWGFGIQSNELKYMSGGNHKFYNGTTNTFTIDGSGNASCIGAISGTSVNLSGAVSCSTINASGGNSYFTGLRINGSDTYNTIYQATGNMGITTNTTDINIGMNTYGYKINITPTTTTINNNLISVSATTLNSTLNVSGAATLNSTFDVSGSFSVNANNVACVNIVIAPATTGTAGYFFINMTNYVNMGSARILLFNCTYAANGWYWMGRLLDNGSGTISNAVDMYSGNLSLATTYTYTGGNYYLKISTSSGLFIASNDRLSYKLIG